MSQGIMSRLKETIYADKEATTSNTPQSPPPPPPKSLVKTPEELFPSSQYLPMKSNNPRINLHTFKCPHDIILAILKHHHMYTMFFAHPRVPQFYLQQFWATMKLRKEDPKNGKEEYIIGRIESSALDITLPLMRSMLNLPD